MRLQVHIIPPHAAPSAAPVSTFLEVALPSLSLEDLTGSITNRYRRLYPHRPPLRIDRLQDSAQNDLDLSYTVEDVFSDKASDTLSSIVRVVQASSVRESSIPPESGLRIGQFARRKRLRPTVMMEDVREASNERGLSHSQPLSHSQSVSLQPSRGSGRQRFSKRQRLNDFLVGDSMDEREENLAVRNWNNEVVSDPIVNLGAGAGFEDYNYDGLLGDEDNDSFKSYHSSPGPEHEDKSIDTSEPNQVRPGLNAPIGNHNPQSNLETSEPIQQRISQVPASPELHAVGRTKSFAEAHASSGSTKHQETSRPLQPPKSSGPIHYNPTATEKLGVRKGALAARAGRQTVAEKLAARADHHTVGGPITGANHFVAPISSTVKPSIYSVPASDEEDNVLPMPTTQTPNSASKRLRQPSIVSETASEEADDESSQQVLGRGTEREKDETEKESESERQAIREERESREREAKEKKDKETREVAAKAAEQRQKAAKAAKERAEKFRIEKERLEKERLEEERLKEERLEKERLEKERLEKERLEKERLEKERLEKEILEKERLEKERLEKERLEKERLEKERLEKERLEKERLEKERLEKERLEKERLEKERLAKEKLEKERLERLKKQKAEKQGLEKEKLERQKIEKKRVAQGKLAAQKAERETIAQEKATHEQATRTRAAKEAAALENEKASQGIADLKAAEAALSVTVLRKSLWKGVLETQEKAVGETPTFKRTTRAAVSKGAVERETADGIRLQEEKAGHGGGKKETAKQKREQEALEKKNKEKAEEEAQKESAKDKKEREALEKKKRLEEQKAEAEAKKEAAKEKKEREALEKKERLEEQRAEREAKKKEAAEERARKAKERAEKAKVEREKKNGRTSEELAQMKEGEVPSQNSLGESESAIPPTPSQGVKSNLKGSAVKKHPTRVSFATTADTSLPPVSQTPIKQTPILPPGYERNNQEAPDWVTTRKTPSSSGLNASQVTSDSAYEASEPVTNGTTPRPKSKANESIKTARAVAGRATSINSKLNGKTPALAIKQSMKKLVAPEPEPETGSETGSETSSETGSESDDSEAEATKATANTLLKSAKAISSSEDAEMPDVPSSPTPKQPFAVAVYNKRNTSDKQVEETESDSEKAPQSGQKAIEETESESDSDSKASASGTDSGSDSESDSGAVEKNKLTLAKTLFKGRTYGKRHSLSANQSINGSQRYKSLTAMEMAPIPDVREVHQSSQSCRNISTPKANSPKLQRSKKPAAPQDEDSEDSDSSVGSSGSSEEEEEEAAKPQNNALNGRMASASAKRKSGFGGFGFKV